MMLCPKEIDQNTLITTLVRQISADPTNKGKKTIRITQHKSAHGGTSLLFMPTVFPHIVAAVTIQGSKLLIFLLILHNLDFCRMQIMLKWKR